jgi:DNA-binding GntR family transcriptional regulator
MLCEKASENGPWLPGEQFPSENELAAMCGVSRAMVRIALANLQRDGD